MTNTHMSVWLVTREYAGIAEAGGVKNVACSLAEGLARNGVSVTVFIPRYGCVRQSGNHEFTTTVTVLGVEHRVAFLSAALHGISIVFIDSPIFFEKDEVYVYT
ncbi:MAG TPA: glycogen/starch synthase, partial [Treponemataceae bacterium]|nr:glycogen/starch synthase [Treponemataceae bacterium]